jgi:ribose transport system substrate-binding protein
VINSPTAPASREGRRRFLFLSLTLSATVVTAGRAHGQQRRYVVAFANLTEDPGVTLEGTGFTGRDVRESFALAARRYPVDMVFYDNGRDARKARANADDAVARKVDLYIQYHDDPAVNAQIATRLKTAGIPVLAVNFPVPGAPLYTADNAAAGRIAGEALATFAARAWRGHPTAAAVVGAVAAQPERAAAVSAALKRGLPSLRIASLDTQGNTAQVAAAIGRWTSTSAGAKLLVAAMDDATALAAKAALESVGRLADGAIVSHGVDRSIHGGMNDRKEIDPNNRGSIVLGSVAFYLDRYGDDVLPLALRMLRGEPVPDRTATRHILITAANVFVEYPPSDMN